MLGLIILEILLLAYSLFLCLRFYAQYCRQKFSPLWMCFFLILFIAGLAAGSVAAGVLGFISASAFFFCWIFPLLLLPGIGWRLWLGHAVSWSMGLLICDVVRQYLAPPLLTFAGGCESLPPTAYVAIQKFLHLSGSGWVWFLTAGLFCLFLSYLLTAKLWTRAAKLPYRQIFGCGVAVLWLFFGVFYLAQLFLSLRGSQAAAREVAALEQRFARPVTAQALGELYFNGEPPDTAFWERETALYENCELFPNKFSVFSLMPDVLPPEAMQQWRQHLQSQDAALSQWEQMFADHIPPIALHFRRGELAAMLLPHLSPIRQLNRLTLWRVRLALEDGDPAAALAASERQAKTNDSLRRETHLIGGLVWIACTDLWLNALEMLLESQTLSDEQLRALNAQLKTVESQVPLMHQRAFYSEAVYGLDCFEMFAEGICYPFDAEKAFKAIPWRKLRYFAPQFWCYNTLDKAALAQSYQCADFSEIPDRTRTDCKPLWLSSTLLSALRLVGKRFHALTAHLRAMQALMAAEQYKRAHGTYPEQLKNLPTDPFNGEALRYRYGDCDLLVKSAVWDENSQCWRVETQQRNAPAVQVWSVGPDTIDDSGQESREQPDGHRSDDIRAVLRMNLSDF